MRDFTRYILPFAILSMLIVSLSCPQTLRGQVHRVSRGDPDAASQAAQMPSSPQKVGKECFAKNCSSCHGELAEGYAGPNLTDKYWIHGAGLRNVAATINTGVPSKGMIGWNTILSPKEIQDVAAYILTLQGSNPPKAKKPEGALHDGR